MMSHLRLDRYISDSANLISENINSDSSRLDAELLIAKALGKTRSFLYSYPEFMLSGKTLDLANHLISLRCDGRPIAYILEKKEFWNFELYVNDSVLIPRPETELLIEFLLTLDMPKKIDIADLGTGSGAIAIALALERKDWNITAVDCSDSALNIARRNISKIIGEKKSSICLMKSNWLSDLKGFLFEVIISNPPYINIADNYLKQGDVSFEPKNALVSSMMGLYDIKSIVEQSRNHLKNNGRLIIEHGFNQEEAVGKIFSSNNFNQVRCYKDLNGLPRFTTGLRN